MSTLKVDALETLDGLHTVNVADLVPGGGGGTTDHGGLTGLADDDHPQYLNNTRGDARYAPVSHTHVAADISNSTTVGRAVLTAADAAAARTAIGAGTGNGDVTQAGTQSITNKTVYAFNNQVNAGNTGTALAISFASGQKQRATLTGNTTLTLSFPGVGNYQLILAQDATGSRTVAFAGTVSYLNSATQPPINTAANGRTLFSIYWDGAEQIIGVAKIGAA